MANRDTAAAATLVEFTLAGRVVEELVDWRNWHGRAAVAQGPIRPAGRGTRTAVTMRTDDTRDLLRYLEQLVDTVAGLDPADRRGVDMLPVRRTIRRLRTLLDLPPGDR